MTGIPNGSPMAPDNEKGFVSVYGSRFSPALLTEALKFITNEQRRPSHAQRFLLEDAIKYGGKQWLYNTGLAETVTTSDFPTLFGVLIQNDMLAKYKAWVADWRSFVPTGTLPNFNAHTYHKVYGQDEVLPQVAENGPYLAVQSGTGHYHNTLAKYGRSYGISWESVINDSMGAFRDIADRFMTAVTRTEARHATEMYSSATGPNAGLFGAPIADVDGQNVTNQGALALSIANLQTTLRLMAAQTDPNGEPISVQGVHLVVPPALEMTARAILTSTTVWATAAAFPGVPNINITPQLGLKLHVDPYLPAVDATGNDNGSWYVFADKAQGKWGQMDFLAGHEEPEICMKASDKLSMSGGPVSPFEGDFDSDDIMYRVRCVHHGTQLDPRYAYAQVSA